MRTIIVYYSLEGNTEFAARRLAKALGAELLRLAPEKAYPTGGVKKFLWGGKSAVMAESPKLRPYTFNAADWDQVILGFPVWASNMAPPIRTFVKENDLRGKRLAAFACQAGSGAERALQRLKALIGAEHLASSLVLIDPKDRPTPQNEEKLAAFAEALRG